VSHTCTTSLNLHMIYSQHIADIEDTTPIQELLTSGDKYYSILTVCVIEVNALLKINLLIILFKTIQKYNFGFRVEYAFRCFCNTSACNKAFSLPQLIKRQVTIDKLTPTISGDN
jgi:hypothetical protein